MPFLDTGFRQEYFFYEDSLEEWRGSLNALVGIMASIVNFSKSLSHASTLCLMNCISCMVAASACRVDKASSIEISYNNMVHILTVLSEFKVCISDKGWHDSLA